MILTVAKYDFSEFYSFNVDVRNGFSTYNDRGVDFIDLMTSTVSKDRGRYYDRNIANFIVNFYDDDKCSEFVKKMSSYNTFLTIAVENEAESIFGPGIEYRIDTNQFIGCNLLSSQVVYNKEDLNLSSIEMSVEAIYDGTFKQLEYKTTADSFPDIDIQGPVSRVNNQSKDYFRSAKLPVNTNQYSGAKSLINSSGDVFKRELVTIEFICDDEKATLVDLYVNSITRGQKFNFVLQHLKLFDDSLDNYVYFIDLNLSRTNTNEWTGQLTLQRTVP